MRSPQFARNYHLAPHRTFEIWTMVIGQLAAYLAILSTELARRASPSQAHEIMVPDESDSGL